MRKPAGLKVFFVKFPAGHIRIIDCKHIMDATYLAEELWPYEWVYVYDPYDYDHRIIRQDYFRVVRLSQLRNFLCLSDSKPA